MAHNLLTFRYGMLDNYLQKYFWTFVLGTLCGAAWLTASITNVFAARALQPPVKSMFTKINASRRASGTENQTKPDEMAFLSRNLFDAEREDLAPIPEPDDETSADNVSIDDGDCIPDRCRASNLSMILVSTWWFGNDSDANVAMFQPSTGGSIETLRVGDLLLDEAEVTTVLRNTVCVSRAGSCEIFTLEAPKKLSKRTPSRPTAAKNDSTVQKVGAKAYEIERAEVDSVLSNLNKIARQARIVPSFKNGKSNGFKLFSIRRNSLYDKLGIKNGDIVQKINGYEMSSPEKVLDIYTKLKDASNITVNLMRRGKPQTMSYSIR